MVKLIITCIFIAFVIFIILFWQGAALNKTDEDRMMDDKEQEEYIRAWNEGHSKNG